jgi:hypothetical protein
VVGAGESNPAKSTGDVARVTPQVTQGQSCTPEKRKGHAVRRTPSTPRIVSGAVTRQVYCAVACVVTAKIRAVPSVAITAQAGDRLARW